jgi:hypothetical protein
MFTNTTIFEYELKKLINLQVEALKNQLAMNSYTEVHQFRYVMGKIAGLNDTIELIEEAKELIEQKNR